MADGYDILQLRFEYAIKVLRPSNSNYRIGIRQCRKHAHTIIRYSQYRDPQKKCKNWKETN